MIDAAGMDSSGHRLGYLLPRLAAFSCMADVPIIFTAWLISVLIKEWVYAAELNVDMATALIHILKGKFFIIPGLAQVGNFWVLDLNF